MCMHAHQQSNLYRHASQCMIQVELLKAGGVGCKVDAEGVDLVVKYGKAQKIGEGQLSFPSTRKVADCLAVITG